MCIAVGHAADKISGKKQPEIQLFGVVLSLGIIAVNSYVVIRNKGYHSLFNGGSRLIAVKFYGGIHEPVKQKFKYYAGGYLQLVNGYGLENI